MALSNWDSFSLNEKSEPINGIYTSPIGIKVAIYKNWLYLYNKGMWRRKCHYIKDTIAEIKYGNFTLHDILVIAERGSQNGIYFAVWDNNYKTVHGMVGIGCYGYDREDFVGVKDASVMELRLMLNRWHDDYMIPDEIFNIDLQKGLRFNQGDAFFAEKLVGGDGLDVATKPSHANKTTVLSKIIEDV